MATGALPFRGESSGVLFKAILDGTPTSAIRLNPDLPLELERIINKCLEKDRNLRFQHASEIRTDLQRLKRDTESSKVVSLPVSSKTPFKGRKFWIVAAVFTAVVGMAVAGAWYLRSGRQSQIDSIAVLPFTNVSGNANDDYLSDGITESLIASLTHVPELKVKSRNSVFRYKGKDVDVQKMGKELDVSALVSGRVLSHGDTLEVSAELTNVHDSTEVWGEHYSIKSADIISLQQQIAGDIAEKLRATLSRSEKQQVTNQGTQNPEAYELYLKGRYYWNKRTVADLETAIVFLNQAIAKDPSYALAYSGLADVYSVWPYFGGSPNEMYPKSNAAARKALELDPSLAHPHAVLGSNEMEYDWDFAAGEVELKKSLELDPNDATSHQWYGQEIGWLGGRPEQAVAEINRAHRLDPLSPIISLQLGQIRLVTREFDEAIANCERLGRENSQFARVHVCLAQAYWGKGMYSETVREFKIFGTLSGDRNEADFGAALEEGFRSAGWKGALTRGIEVRQAQRKTGYYPASNIAALYAALGDKDRAFQWLETAYRERDWHMEALNTDFTLDPLRSDPRFAELVRRVGLPQ